MICPTCDHFLQKITVTTTTGGKFEIDHCGYCGGTWFDPYEINRIPYYEVVKLAKDTVLPQKSFFYHGSHKCPLCGIKLNPYHPEIVPVKVKFLRCPKCHGVFATQKDLENFKLSQEEKIKEYKSKNTAFPSLSVVFLPTLFLVLIIFTTLITLSQINQTQEQEAKAEEIIQSVQTIPLSETEVYLIFQTKIPVKAKFSYGVSLDKFSSITISPKLSNHHQIMLKNLKTDALYFYQIILEDEKGEIFKTEIKTFSPAKNQNKI